MVVAYQFMGGDSGMTLLVKPGEDFTAEDTERHSHPPPLVPFGLLRAGARFPLSSRTLMRHAASPALLHSARVKHV